MTIRNAIPTFGMRSVVALVVLAVAALAALLAVGSPASAQSLTGDEIWSATMTVGVQNHLQGYWNTDPVNIGSITDDQITIGPNSHSVNILTQSSSADAENTVTRQSVFFSPGIRGSAAVAFTDNELKSMTLQVSDESFAFEDATRYGASNSDVGYSYSWPRPSGMSVWTNGQTVAVSITAVPVITVEAVTTTVEYGGNNNAAESTAEFKFTRYGSTDEALSFTLQHAATFKAVTRTFKAGESSFSNFHWAVDVGNNGNPLCLIIWQVNTSGDGSYVQGTPSSATVVVEGPGTTCMGGG